MRACLTRASLILASPLDLRRSPTEVFDVLASFGISCRVREFSCSPQERPRTSRWKAGKRRSALATRLFSACPTAARALQQSSCTYRFPDGVIVVKPQPKPGWQVETVDGKYDKAYTYEGTKLDEGVREIIWSGGKLPDKFYDEFVFQGFLTDSLKPGTSIYFPVVQECEKGIARWIQIPAEGKASDDYETPAPGLKLMPNAGSDD